MKRIIISVILALAVVLSCAVPAFASASDEWILGENASYIKNGDRILKPVEYYCAEELFGFVGNTTVRELDFVDYVTEQRYWGAYIEFIDKYWVPIVSCYIRTSSGLYSPVTRVLFVDEAFMETYQEIKRANTAQLVIVNGYGVDCEINHTDYKRANNGTKIKSSDIDADFVNSCSRYNVYAYDNNLTGFKYLVGEVLLDSQGAYYVLNYNEYDSSYFSNNGTFNYQTSKDYAFYRVEDTKLQGILDKMRETVPDSGVGYWTIAKNASAIMYKDRVYKPVVYNAGRLCNFMTINFHTIYPAYVDTETRSRFDGSYITYTKSSEDKVLRCNIATGGVWTMVIYVEESYMATFMQLRSGAGGSYMVQNLYGYEMKLVAGDFVLLDDGAQLVSPRGEFGFNMSFQRYDVYAVDALADLTYKVGEILYDNGSKEFYYLSYKEYDESYFLSSGEFRLSTDQKVTIYRIEDENLIQSLITLSTQVPDDALAGIGGDNTSGAWTATVGGITFIGLPLAVCVLCAVLLIKNKRRMYRPALITLLCSSAVLAAAAAGIMVWIIRTI